jgi:hypothetical protein
MLLLFLKSFSLHSRTHGKLVKGQNIKNQNVESQKEHWKFEKDQNVKSQIRLLTFWSFLTP